MSLYTQQSRRLAVHTPLGEDALLLEHATGVERLSGLFHFELQMTSESDDLDYRKIVGQGVTIVLREEHEERVRHFHGHVSRFAYLGHDDRLSHYRAEVVPWLWFLTRNTDCSIFQDMTVPEIIEDVFQAYGFTDYEMSIDGTHAKREFCVQYRESDFNFVSRLMEEEGIFYFFRHEPEKHTLVITDHKGAYEDCPELDREVELAANMSGIQQSDRILKWEHSQSFRSGRVALNDFNFKEPGANLLTSTNTKMKVDDAALFELYDYPGRYVEKPEGDDLTRIRMEEEETHHDIAHGESVCRGFAPGLKFTLARHDSAVEQNHSYVLVEVRHEMHGGGYETTSIAQRVHDKPDYSNHFVCIPDSVVFRPESATPKPIVHGSQTATVVGPEGDEIYTDEYGRVKVQFHWDRYGKADADSSCWVRVSQLFAGKKWGAMFIPRIGHEVIVDFLEGDPDRPIITGRVYNEEQKVPYDLPENKTISTIKTLSSKDGEGFNEIRFEDKKGEEQLFLHAERNQDVRVKNDSLEWIGNDRHLIVENDQMEQVVGDKHLMVDGDQNEKIKGTLSQIIDSDFQQKIGSNHAIDAGSEIHLKAGMTAVIEAGTSLTLKVGGNSVVIDSSGVTVKGSMVTIDGSMVKIASGPGSPAGSGSGSSPDAAMKPKEADKADPGEMWKPPKPEAFSPAAKVLQNAAANGTPFCEQCEKAKQQ